MSEKMEYTGTDVSQAIANACKDLNTSQDQLKIEVLAAGTLLSARLSLVIAVAALGARLNLVDRELESQVILLAVVTATVAPTVFRALAPKLVLPGPREARDAAPNGTLDPGLPSSAPMR